MPFYSTLNKEHSFCLFPRTVSSVAPIENTVDITHELREAEYFFSLVGTFSSVFSHPIKEEEASCEDGMKGKERAGKGNQWPRLGIRKKCNYTRNKVQMSLFSLESFHLCITSPHLCFSVSTPSDKRPPGQESREHGHE